MEQLIQDLRNLMHSLPNYAPQFLEMVCKMLTIFKESCYDAYKGYCHLLSHSLRKMAFEKGRNRTYTVIRKE